MKKMSFLLFINSLLIQSLFSQTMIQLIEYTYNTLDSVSYNENVILLYKEEVKKKIIEMDDLTLELGGFDYNNLDSVQRQNIIDSIRGKTMCSKSQLRERTRWFASAVKDNPVHYVLNLRVDSCEQSDNHIGLLPDTTSFPFNLFYFDKHSNLKFFVLVDNGQISHYDSYYRTFSEPIGENAPIVFNKILRKKPKYLLYSYDLEQMNTILYALNDKIYVYRIAQMEEFELSDYIEKFMLNPR